MAKQDDNWKGFVRVLCVTGLLSAGSLHAAGEVDTIQTTDQAATPFRYTIDGTTYTWGAGNNQIMESFTMQGNSFHFADSADRVELRRDDVADVSTGNPCGVFVERLGASSLVLKADYPSDGSGTGNCDMAEMMASRVINRGALNLFSNTAPTPKNVERVDYLFDYGAVAPFSASALPYAGHVVAEKRGNNPILVAAITSIDIFGQPASYGPLVRVNGHGCVSPAVCYGVTNLRHNYSFFQNSSLVPQGYPSFIKDSTESVGMAFVSAKRLGLSAGQRYFGFSYFPEDVDEKLHNLVDPSTFPNDTQDEDIVPGDGADIYGGVSGYFLADHLSVGTGDVFMDENANSIRDSGEAGISDVNVSLYSDSNSNGVFDKGIDAQTGSSFNSNLNGELLLPGLSDGGYFLLLDESDTDIPPGIHVDPNLNPLHFVVAGDDHDNLDFAFISNGGTDSGGTDSGGTDSGGTDSGGTDSGGTDSGGTDSGGTDSGGTDSGGTDSGGTDSGGTDSGGTDSGGTDSGGTDSGGTDSGDPIDDGSNPTKAVADIAVVDQGKSVAINVLANDVDGTGEGLTIVSVATPPNGTAVIENGEIVYTPDFGFYGDDAFFYVMEDSAGTQDTGNVSVEVIRFSDLDNNGLNDFIECGCDNLSLEVGVRGNALGATSLLWLLLVSSVFACRRFGVSA